MKRPSIPTRLALAAIRFYQRSISPHKRYSSCRYQPTCSCYAQEAFRTHGFCKGLVLSLWRILRCNPFSKGGYDPVPPKRERK